jgi:monoamine oxidase
MQKSELIFDIIIIGAGPSGIGASLKLKEYKLSSVILEAQDRVGGRVYT